ncbi:HD domain-containing phosphohydrolase [Oribacterium sp. FC2011]|uniref:HD domain-containing phosphohydrolase n=1 Tax=Oribacterium sp. FC2011 TaxID=1408311 RepID=UPI0004E1F00E|nr:HD domain-containing phosphohydrolase [Oribacterium sp. FC2011]
MIELIAAHQLNIMLALGSICGMTAFFSLISRFISVHRKASLIGMELSAMVLLFADRFAYIYRGQADSMGFFMTRISNFLVFSMTIGVIFSVNQYIKDVCTHEGGSEKVPGVLYVNDELAAIGILLIIVSQITGFYYMFDESNYYVRSPGFAVSYIVPFLMAILELSVVLKHYRRLRKKLFVPLVIFSIMPIAASVIQLFVYGISMINICLSVMVVIIYIFVLMDMNEFVERAHRVEMESLRQEKMSMKRMFDQTANAFVAAVEKKDPFLHGHAARVADIAKKIAKQSGKNDEDCEKIYYAALLHDIGMIGLPDSLIGKTDNLTEEEYEIVKKKPLMSWEILSSITEYPFLSQGAHYSYERYDGKGYPDGLSGTQIPEISRIISVANSYDAMVTEKRFRGPLPMQIVREELLNESGGQFDPEFSQIMIQIIDSESRELLDGTDATIEKELKCENYRDNVTVGIPISNDISKLRFKCTAFDKDKGTALPSIILFESFDRHIHSNAKSIEAYKYYEYGELWFDGHIISTGARNTEVKLTENTYVYSRSHRDDMETSDSAATADKDTAEHFYEIVMGRYEDHIKLQLRSAESTVDAIVALPSKSKLSFLGLTGENCCIYDIEVEQTEDSVKEGDIPRIAEEVSYIDRLSSDMPNVQVDRNRSASTAAIEIKDWTQLRFHSMSLPSASLVWDCPYIVIYTSEDKKINGKGYHEYALIKLNGENENSDEYAENKFTMRKTEVFTNWEDWKRLNKDGVEYEVVLLRRGNRVTLDSENLGIFIENITRIRDGNKKVYAAITGNQVAITDIRIQ